MDRRAWLHERRAATQRLFDEDLAATYDADDSPITPTHRRFVERLIGETPEQGTILDAPCGTGRYFPIVLGAGRTVIGIDQSSGMLNEARRKHPDVELHQLGLQELDFEARVDGAMCIDAMENVPPEDWPLVLDNLRRAVRPGAAIYLTVEQIDPGEIRASFDRATAEGLPVMLGETARDGGYHHYPTEAQVAGWLATAGLGVVEQGQSRGSNYGYWHLLLRATAETV